MEGPTYRGLLFGTSAVVEFGITNACNGAGGRVGFEIKAYRAGPLMRNVRPKSLELLWGV